MTISAKLASLATTSLLQVLHFLPVNGAYALKTKLLRLAGVTIDPSTCINGYQYVTNPTNLFVGCGAYVDVECIFDNNTSIIRIGDHAFIGARTQVLTTNHVGAELFLASKPVTIEAWARVGAGSIVLPGVTIGEHAVIGAGSVVTRDVAAGQRVAGAPARVLKSL